MNVDGKKTRQWRQQQNALKSPLKSTNDHSTHKITSYLIGAREHRTVGTVRSPHPINKALFANNSEYTFLECVVVAVGEFSNFSEFFFGESSGAWCNEIVSRFCCLLGERKCRQIIISRCFSRKWLFAFITIHLRVLSVRNYYTIA